MQTQTLEQLVQDTVNTFLSSGQAFSVYDVTTNIRNLVNSGAVEPSDVLFNPTGNFFEIEHSEVKGLFTDLYEDNGFDQPLARNFNGSFFLYFASSAPQSAPAPVSAKVSPVQSLANAINASGSGSAVVVPASGSGLDRATVISRVRQYLNGCNSRGFTPTARQIQSAIKRNGKSTGWSRSDLNKIRNGINAGTI